MNIHDEGFSRSGKLEVGDITGSSAKGEISKLPELASKEAVKEKLNNYQITGGASDAIAGPNTAIKGAISHQLALSLKVIGSKY